MRKKKVITLKERIEKDLTELFNGRPVSEAIRLPKKLHFSTRGLPQHFVGNRKAETVLVMLNPGMDSKLADKGFFCKTCHYNCKTCHYNRKNAMVFMRDYMREKECFGHMDRMRLDPFDLKQAAFLREWKRSGIGFPRSFTGIKGEDSESARKAAKEAVLMNKLQLELVPYCSRKFDAKLFAKERSPYKTLIPFLETILHEIVSRKRKYVVFCSAVFEPLFREYEHQNPGTFSGLEGKEVSMRIAKYSGRCRVICIHYNNRDQMALIAHTFPSHSFSGGGLNMVEYGKFCYDVFNRAKRPRRKSKEVNRCYS